MEYSRQDKELWDLLTNNPEFAAKYLAHLQEKEARKQVAINGDHDSKEPTKYAHEEG